jgi:probable O-glycosylation ligase (exosortase A-associated)
VITTADTTWWRPASAAPQARPDAAQASRIAFAGLVAFTFILLLAPQSFIPALKVIRIALLAATVAILGHLLDATIRHKPIIPAIPEMGITLTLLAWAVLTMPFSYWPGGSVQLLTDSYLKAIIFFWLIGTLVTTMPRLRVFAWTLALCSVPLAGMAVQHYLSGDFLHTGVDSVTRIAGHYGLTGNPNDLALTLNLIIPIAGALLFTSRSALGRLLAASAILISVPAVILTFSRAGFLTLGAIVLASLIFLAKQRAPRTAAVIVVAMLAATPMIPSGYIDRLSTITDMEADATGSAQGRWADFELAGTVVAQNPILGVGMGQDMLALNEVRGRSTWRSVHNAFLQYAVDLGLPGLALFLWLLISSFRSARAVERRAAKDPASRDLTIYAAGVQIALLAFAVAACFHPIAYQFYFFCVAGMAVALMNACRDRLRQRAVPVSAS